MAFAVRLRGLGSTELHKLMKYRWFCPDPKQCPVCGVTSSPATQQCYACGTSLEQHDTDELPCLTHFFKCHYNEKLEEVMQLLH
jgi:hypothetical protein